MYQIHFNKTDCLTTIFLLICCKTRCLCQPIFCLVYDLTPLFKCFSNSFTFFIIQMTNTCIFTKNINNTQPVAYRQDQQETPAQVFCCEFYKILKNTYFVVHLQMAASVNTPVTANSYYNCSLLCILLDIFCSPIWNLEV